MRITKRIREQAALICAIAASNPGEWFRSIEIYLGCAEDEAHWRHWQAAHQLAVRAWGMAGARTGDPTCDAEAEALLRTGWTP